MLRQIFAVVFIALSTQITANSLTGHHQYSGNGEKITTEIGINFSALNVTSIQNFLLEGTLTESTKTEDTEAGTFTYQFHDFGIVDIISENSTGELTITTLFWDLEESSDGIVIVLADPPTGLTFELLVEHITEDQMVINLDGKTVTLDSNASLPSETIDQLENVMSGSWGTKSYPFDVINDIDRCGAFEEMNGAYLSYQFNTDGTFARMMGSQMVAMEEAGIWEVTKDGKYVIFYTSLNGNPEDITGIQVAKIIAVSGDSMILSQALTAPKSDFDTLFCTTTKDFKMNKTEATSAIR